MVYGGGIVVIPCLIFFIMSTVNISIEYNGTFLFCRVDGKNTVDNVKQYLSVVHSAMEEHGCRKVLILENLSGRGLGLLDIYQVIRTAKKTVLSLPHLIAYIDANPEHDHASIKFAETTALNRFINIRVFTSVNDATEWLERISV
jgi:hypothetical protein